MVFEAVLQLLADFGFFRVVLPFLLIFAIFYAVLLKTGVLGRPEEDPWTKGIAGVIAMVVAFFVISYTPVVDALATLLPQASFLLIVLMLFLMMMAFIVPDWGDIAEKKWLVGLAAIVLIIIFLALVGASVGEDIPWLYGFAQAMTGAIELTPELVNLLIGFGIVIGVPILVMALIIWGAKKD